VLCYIRYLVTCRATVLSMMVDAHRFFPSLSCHLFFAGTMFFAGANDDDDDDAVDDAVADSASSDDSKGTVFSVGSACQP